MKGEMKKKIDFDHFLSLIVKSELKIFLGKLSLLPGEEMIVYMYVCMFYAT